MFRTVCASYVVIGGPGALADPRATAHPPSNDVISPQAAPLQYPKDKCNRVTGQWIEQQALTGVVLMVQDINGSPPIFGIGEGSRSR